MLLHQASYLQWRIESLQRGAVLGGLNTSTIATLCVVVPPIREQKEVVETITSVASALATASDAVLSSDPTSYGIPYPPDCRCGHRQVGCAGGRGVNVRCRADSAAPLWGHKKRISSCMKRTRKPSFMSFRDSSELLVAADPNNPTAEHCPSKYRPSA